MNYKKQKIIVTVIKTYKKKATINFNAPQQNNCKQCKNKNGCQSFSIYHLFFAKKAIYINNQDYHIGQQLNLRFPDRLIIQTIVYLFGLPLIAFIAGIFIAAPIHEIVAFVLGLILSYINIIWGIKIIREKLSNALTIS